MIDDMDDDCDAALQAAFDGDSAGLQSSDARGAPSGPPTIAGYQLLAEIGAGGMGVVYEAEQLTPRRRVALKIIKQGMDTRQVVARFEQERQALALMDHPNIARVIDAGATDAGRPFFVMELVEGEPICHYCDKHRLSIDARLELFEQVCQAVQHAHSKGLIHRDIKPSNLLVGTQDGRPVAKVIDFGIAKATGARLTEMTLLTEHLQVIGTLQYMSPEQAEGSLDIDTRSDVYSLGVVLYELLTGATPFDARTLGGAMLGEIQRQIREVDPPWPSTRLRDSTDTIVDLAARRRVEPRRLSQVVHGELDWIAMKALEKDRARRYGSALELALDVQRYLDGDAVAAAPPSRAYRLRKFARRNRAAVSAVAAVAVSLVLGMAGTAWQARIASDQRDAALAAQDAEAEQRRIAVAQRDSADQVAIFLSETLSGAGPSVALGRDTTILAEMLDRAAARITNGELAVAPEAELRLRLAIGRTYIDLAHYPEAERLLEPVLPMARALFPGDSMETAHCLSTLGWLAKERDELTEAEDLIREGLAMLRRVYGGDHSRVAAALHELGAVVRRRGRLDDAERLLRDTLAMTERLFPEDHDDRVASLIELSMLLDDRGDAAGAEAACRAALAMKERLYGPDHPNVGLVRNNLAVNLLLQGKHELALPLIEEALASLRKLHPGDHPSVAVALGNLGVVIQDHGDVSRAEPLFREALAMRRRLFPGDHRLVATALDNLAKALMPLGQEEEAERLMTESVDMRRRLETGDHPDLAIGLVNLARILAKRGRPGDGEALVREALAMRRRLFPEPHDGVAAFLVELARALIARRELQEAESSLREALSIHDVVHPGSTPQRALCLVLIGSLLVDVGDAAGAEPFIREGCEIYAQLDDAELFNALEAKSQLARLWWSLGRLDRSIPLFEELLEQRSVTLGRREARTLATIANLGVNYRDAGRLGEALALLEEARGAAAECPSVAWVSNPLLEAYVQSGRGEDAAALVPEVLAWMKGAYPPESPEVAARLHWLGENMAAVAQWERAEEVLRACVERLERDVPDHWRRYQASSRLGEALFQQGDHAAAAPLLQAGHDGLAQREASIPKESAATELRDAADRLVRLYESWHRSEPGLGHDAAASAWRAARDAHALRVPVGGR